MGRSLGLRPTDVEHSSFWLFFFGDIRVTCPYQHSKLLFNYYYNCDVIIISGCSDDIMTSDHSPLFSNFQVGVRGQYVSKEGNFCGMLRFLVLVTITGIGIPLCR